MQIIEDVAPFYRSLLALIDILDQDSVDGEAFGSLKQDKRLELQSSTEVFYT